MCVCDISVFSEGDLPQWVQVWQPQCEKADIMLLSTHSDDEQLFFAGLLPSLIGGSIIVEHIFDIPGMGELSFKALSNRDYPLQMALFIISGALTLLGILISDILYTIADPRVKLD